MTEIDLDSWYLCLANERRRSVIGYLRDRKGEAISLESLAEHITDQETDSADPDRRQVAIELHHNALPMLDEHGIVNYDVVSQSVKYRAEPEVAQLIFDN